MKNTLTKSILEMGDIEAIQPDFSVLKVIPKDHAGRAKALLFDKEGTTFAVLTTNEKPQELKDLLSLLESKKIKTKMFYTDARAFDKALLWYDTMEAYEKQLHQQKVAQQKADGLNAENVLLDLFKQKDTLDDGKYITDTIKYAFQAGASDIHFQPENIGVILRIRKDGVLKSLVTYTHSEFKKYLLKIKFIAGVKMNVDYMPQDGRFDFTVGTDENPRKIDVRVSIMPGLRGEGIVMRFLDAQESNKTFTDLGYDSVQTEIIQKQLHKNFGMILVTGPTGSGKTTTLYSMLHYINLPGKKIVTLEDPVEYEVPGIEQSPINVAKGYTFEEGLKSVLRHDPDVIMVGEIRTAETAEIAFNAALTGHLVLATIHTNSAAEAITRLLNLGIKPYMLGPAINMIIGQRLLRKIHDCRVFRETTDAEFQDIMGVLKTIHDIAPRRKISFTKKVPHPVGCDTCQSDGYKGRIAAVEIVEFSPELKQMIVDEKSSMELYGAIRQSGFLTMKEDAYLKMLDGKTTLDEIRRVI